MDRRPTRQVMAGSLAIGGGAPVSAQTMTNTDTLDTAATLAQIVRCADAGAALVRVAVPALRHAEAFGWLAARSPVPLAADIHFDWRVAVAALRQGAAKIRVNPGNMEDGEGLALVAREAQERGAAIRLGLNAGSLPAAAPGDGRGLPERLAGAALAYAARFEELGFSALVISAKTPDPATAVAANRLIAARSDYPLHLGVTHAGLPEDALLPSAVALGALLLDGIGDTLRVSFCGPPEAEAATGQDILRAAGLLRDRPRLIACPTCGRARTDVASMARLVRARLSEIGRPLTVAVMGCEVNGPGEAREADCGLAATAGGQVALFAGGQLVSRHPPGEAVDALLAAARGQSPERATP